MADDPYARIAQLEAENAALRQRHAGEISALSAERDAALEQQTAMAEVLRVIASSPIDLRPVLDTIVASASRLTEATEASVWRVDGDILQFAASLFSRSPDRLRLAREQERPIDGSSPIGQAVLERRTVRVDDFAALGPGLHPESRASQRRVGFRSYVATPLVQGADVIGVLVVSRPEVRPFSDAHVALLETFADQAVIAIENARLFEDLREALEQQTATAEVLRIIAGSPTDLTTVLGALAEKAANVCGGVDAHIRLLEAGGLRHVAAHGTVPGQEIGGFLPAGPGSVGGLAVVERRTVHVSDLLAEPPGRFSASRVLAERFGFRSVVSTPLLRDGAPIGNITLRRIEPQPFTAVQIRQLESFADQAVIAIENARLFEELEIRNRELSEALEQQTATAEILRVIASSPTDAQPVLDAIAESAMRLSESTQALLSTLEADHTTVVALAGDADHPLGAIFPLAQRRVGTVAVRERRTIHVPDLSDPAFLAEFPDSVFTPARTSLAIPLIREGAAIGSLSIGRDRARPFTDTQIALMETFADQAVIAIENARLFSELERRNRELSEALEQQTATADLLRVIASNPTDLQPILDAIAHRAALVCESDYALIRLVDGEYFVL